MLGMFQSIKEMPYDNLHKILLLLIFSFLRLNLYFKVKHAVFCFQKWIQLATLRNMLMASCPALGSISPEGVMPRNLLSDFPEATHEISPKRTLGSMEGGGAVENCGNQARCKNLAMVST